MLPKWAWSESREQFLHCGLRKFRHSKSSVYRWYPQVVRRRFVYDSSETMTANRRVMVECTLSITHCLRLNLQLHTIDLVRTCRISSFCTVAWQLARFQLTWRIARSLGDSWASCFLIPGFGIGDFVIPATCNPGIQTRFWDFPENMRFTAVMWRYKGKIYILLLGQLYDLNSLVCPARVLSCVKHVCILWANKMVWFDLEMGGVRTFAREAGPATVTGHLPGRCRHTWQLLTTK